ncbi:MAG: formyltransferase [Candidatus Didemnitutus sp.]|nr:formyltransferase [Candidatus Didemnitutus sp.]
MSRPRILLFAYSEIGTECLAFLLERGAHVVALVTHADAPGETIWFRTPAATAEHAGIPVFLPESVNTPEWRERLVALQPDLILSAYYRHLIGTRLLSLARLGAFNLHGSLLPRYRGRAPLNWALVHGEPRVGLTLHRMVARADAGAIVDQESVDLSPRDTAEQAFRKILPLVRAILARQLDALLAGNAPETPQDETQATYFGARTPADGRIDWRWPTTRIFNLVRAVTAPYPGAFTEADGARLMVWWAEPAPGRPGAAPGETLSLEPLVVATGDGALALTRHEWRGVHPAWAPGRIFPS